MRVVLLIFGGVIVFLGIAIQSHLVHFLGQLLHVTFHFILWIVRGGRRLIGVAGGLCSISGCGSCCQCYILAHQSI
jgi:hypothetical protein